MSGWMSKLWSCLIKAKKKPLDRKIKQVQRTIETVQ